jgi:hypothetical protein
MPSHKFHVGESVTVTPAIRRNVPGGVYEVTKQLPCHAFKRTRQKGQKECVQMPVKIARSTPRLAFGLPEVLVAVSTSRPS